MPTPLSLAVSTTLALLLSYGCAGRRALPASAPSALLDKPMPDFQRTTLQGSSIDTKSLRGRVVVVKFFAEYCEPCKRTLPAAAGLARERSAVAFVGISEDERESVARAITDQYKLGFPVVHDQAQVLSGRYRVREMPVTFVVNAQGVVKWVGGPEQAEGDLARAIDAIAP